jgi:branched-chain amino acid aminotransferase
MNYYNEHTVLWLDGHIVKASEAKTDLYGQSLHYGYAVFEGIRSYRTAAGTTKIFKATEHFDRLKRSADAMNLPYHYSDRRNDPRYLRSAGKEPTPGCLYPPPRLRPC